MKFTPQGSSSHELKHFPLWGSLTKDYKIYTMVLTIFLQGFLFTYDTSTSFDPINNMKLLNANYEAQKLQSLPLIYLKEKSGWIINHIHLHLFPMYQTNHQVPLITSHPFMDRFYIIGNLGFGQIYILDLPLLLTWNNYLNYSIINPYVLNQKILLVRPMRFIILFPIFIHIITPTLILLFVITSSYFVFAKPLWGCYKH